MPEFLELRFSRGSRNVLSLLTIASLVLTKIAVTIYAGDVVVRTLLGIDTVNIFGIQMDVFWAIALGLAFTTGLYTVLGGLRVIMYTAVLRAPVLILGSVCILYAGLNALGRRHCRRLARNVSGHWREHSSHSSNRRPGLVLGGCAAGIGDHRLLVLVYGSVHRPAGSRWEESAAIAARGDPGRFSETDTGVHLSGTGHDRLCAFEGTGVRLHD